MANKHSKRSSILLLIREVQTKYHFTSIRLVNTVLQNNIKCWEKCRETEYLASENVKIGIRPLRGAPW